ncbi:HNH endonuclease signature motif containing protein [Anaerotignum sp.]
MAKEAYTPEMHELIRKYATTRTNEQIAEMLFERFGILKTKEQIRYYKRKNGLKSINGGVSTIPAEIREFIHENYKGNGYQAMADLIREKFGVEYTADRIRSYYKNHRLKCGVDTRFQKGVRFSNGGRKGSWFPGCEKHWFKKGQKPASWVPVGTERIRKNGYIWVKIAEPKTWRMKQMVVWEAANGPVPEGHHLLFRDGNKLNCDLSNLMLLPDKTRGVLNQSGLANVGAECIDTAIRCAEMKMAINAAKRRKK